MRYTHVVFDVDGTLSDSIRVNYLAVDATMRILHGRPATDQEKFVALGMTLDQLFASYPPEQQAHAKSVMLAQYANCNMPLLYDGVRQTIGALKALGVGLGVITSRNSAELQYDTNFAHIAPYFDCLIPCDTVAHPKPAPDSLFAYMEKTGARACDILYVGDTIMDVGCAKNAGVDFALAVWGTLEPQLQAQYYPASISQIVRILQGDMQT